MEGADTWYYDEQTAVHGMFGIQGTEDGTGDLSTIHGMEGTMTEGMEFTYTGDNGWVDHLVPDGGTLIFQNMNPQYGTAVSNDAGTYRTIGSSMEFGGLQDGDYTKDDLMIQILDFFGIPGVWTSVEERTNENGMDLTVCPNPVTNGSVVRFNAGQDTKVALGIYNLQGQKVAQLFDGKVSKGDHQLNWNCRGLTPGMYFLRIQAANKVSVTKILVAD